MSVVKIVGIVAIEAARAAVTAARRFNRKMTPRELKEEYARWEHNHMPRDPGARCLVCGVDGASRDVRCPGTLSQQRARAELAAGDDVLHPMRRAR